MTRQSSLPALAGEGIQMALEYLTQNPGLPWPRHVVGQCERDGEAREVVMVEDFGFPPAIFIKLVRLTLLCERCTSYYVVGEAWQVSLGPGETAPDDLSEDPQRQEVLLAISSNGSEAYMKEAPILRDGELFAGLGEVVTREGSAVRGNLTRLLFTQFITDEERQRAQLILDSLAGERGGPIHHINPASGKRLVTC